MKREKLFISTTAGDAEALAVSRGLGLEIAEFCTAYNMDTYLDKCLPIVQEKMRKAERFAFHAAFNELCPAAIDPLVLELTRKRYNQAFDLAALLGIRKIIIHSGYVPLIYYKSWFSERSVEFWKDFMEARKEEDITVCLENVMEDEPQLLTDIVRELNDRRFRLCLDIGHANCQSRLPLASWVECTGPYLEHVHIHNNFGTRDTHETLNKGNVNMEEVIGQIEAICPAATFTIENMKAEASVEWLLDREILV
jgi:sugar phosphate isomerase/epimerase